MLQGTGSAVGKSVLVAALCRILHQDGLRVAPFKAQNMALNSFVTREGGEMGRAQVVQAEAAGIEPTVDMNPILIKPEADARSQVVVLGKPAFTLPAWDYYRHTEELMAIVERSFQRLASDYDLILIEGAGSPAEVNLREREIVNMRVARMARAPVLLVGDIDKGGVFASLVGTLMLLRPRERARVKGFIINKFRGDLAILKPGLEWLERYTQRPVLGVVPYYHHIFINEEDSLHNPFTSLDGVGMVDIAVIHLPRLSNSTDFEPLQQEPGVRLRYVSHPPLGEPDAIVLPGTKSTMADLAHLRRSGLAEAILQRARAGTPVMGICGGFQMLGREVRDPEHVESPEEAALGLGLLEVITWFEREKATRQVRARVLGGQGFLAGLEGQEVAGYEIHMGRTAGEGVTPAFLIAQTPAGPAGYPDGAVAAGGQVLGTYLHGLFDNQNLRYAFLSYLRGRKGLPLAPSAPLPTKEEQYNRLADLVRASLDIGQLYRICGLPRR